MDDINFSERKKQNKVFLGLTLDPKNVKMLKEISAKNQIYVSQVVNIILDDFRLGYLKKQLEKKK